MVASCVLEIVEENIIGTNEYILISIPIQIDIQSCALNIRKIPLIRVGIKIIDDNFKFHIETSVESNHTLPG